MHSRTLLTHIVSEYRIQASPRRNLKPSTIFVLSRKQGDVLHSPKIFFKTPTTTTTLEYYGQNLVDKARAVLVAGRGGRRTYYCTIIRITL